MVMFSDAQLFITEQIENMYTTEQLYKGAGRTFTYYVTNQNIFLHSFYCHTKWTLLLKLLEVTC